MPSTVVPAQGKQGPESEGVLQHLLQSEIRNRFRARGPGQGWHTRGRVDGERCDPASEGGSLSHAAKGAEDEVPPSSLPHLHAPLSTYRYIFSAWFLAMLPHCTGTW